MTNIGSWMKFVRLRVLNHYTTTSVYFLYKEWVEHYLHYPYTPLWLCAWAQSITYHKNYNPRLETIKHILVCKQTQNSDAANKIWNKLPWRRSQPCCTSHSGIKRRYYSPPRKASTSVVTEIKHTSSNVKTGVLRTSILKHWLSQRNPHNRCWSGPWTSVTCRYRYLVPGGSLRRHIALRCHNSIHMTSLCWYCLLSKSEDVTHI